jgi:hypothetical protein
MATKKKPLNPKMTVNRNPEKVGAREVMPKKITPGTPRPSVKPKPKGPIKKTSTSKTPIFQMPKKTTKKTTSPMPKARNKKAPVPMPTTKSGDINPFKMTPQQKLEYLRNPERYSRG